MAHTEGSQCSLTEVSTKDKFATIHEAEAGGLEIGKRWIDEKKLKGGWARGDEEIDEETEALRKRVDELKKRL